MADFKKQNKEFESKMDNTKVMDDENGQRMAVGTNPLNSAKALEALSSVFGSALSGNNTAEIEQSYDNLKRNSMVSAPFATMMKSPTFNEIASGIKPYAVGEDIQKAFTNPAAIDVEKNKEVYKNLLERYKQSIEAKKAGRGAEEGLRKELAPHVKRITDIDTSYNKILKASESPSAANDITMVFNFMKLQDPGSTVREGEYATAANAAGIPDRVRAMYNRALKGETLSPPQRADFTAAARNTYLAEKENYEKMISGYKKVASNTGADWSNIDVYQSDRQGLKAKPTVTVSNGKETLIIPAEDLIAAKKDGYNEVK
jgi:hypothetical protein